MPLLAIETSCDETSAAVIHEGAVLANVVASQTRLHAEYGGVVPELAAREHLKNLLPVVHDALARAGMVSSQLTGLAAARGPGLPNALLVGLKAAQACAFALKVPFVGIHHHEAHLYSPWISGDPLTGKFQEFQPNISLIVSGGHTMLVHVPAEFKHRVIGRTQDDAAGECFDKIGKLLGLGYPAGPQVDRLAKEGNARAYEFPRPMLHEANHDFSFSGLKTSVRYFLQAHPEAGESDKSLRDLCASVQAAIVDVLVAKTMRAAERAGVRCITASGGVTCNSALRRDLAQEAKKRGIVLRLAEPVLCTDNAAMIGVVAERRLKLGFAETPLDSDFLPNWNLADASEELRRVETTRPM